MNDFIVLIFRMKEKYQKKTPQVTLVSCASRARGGPDELASRQNINRASLRQHLVLIPPDVAMLGALQWGKTEITTSLLRGDYRGHPLLGVATHF